MNSNDGQFATAILCIDGRAHPPVRAWMRERLGVSYIDRLTIPGPDRLLADGSDDDLAGLRAQAAISLSAHGSRVIVVAGHHDCAGNPVDEATHRAQIRRAVERVAGWGWPVRVIGLWIDRRWQAEYLCETIGGLDCNLEPLEAGAARASAR